MNHPAASASIRPLPSRTALPPALLDTLRTLFFVDEPAARAPMPAHGDDAIDMMRASKHALAPTHLLNSGKMFHFERPTS